jgi:hypothetical protein
MTGKILVLTAIETDVIVREGGRSSIPRRLS